VKVFIIVCGMFMGVFGHACWHIRKEETLCGVSSFFFISFYFYFFFQCLLRGDVHREPSLCMSP